ncbi:MAG: S-adenosylmethionine--diacylglycerol 3-amino-3-carboxypropyl transferase [Crocinitomicaceae bacterium]|nr:S-adenosylmethionine--diacylglycerol 3-amino-3-carboxypropyl transferase [Crocinitomicaceae bacterium]|tara:strand:+ start:10072 stop:11157 length:1086 start_codon:yes stop_codon:yes gene_type:complete
MGDQLEKIRHNYIRYANCWEDADVLLDGLQVQPNDRVFSIGSAGDNSFSLLVNDPAIVVAVDINLVQLYLIELKKAAFKSLDYRKFLEFLGFQKSARRKALYSKVAQNLEPDINDFWTLRISEIENGIIYQGKFEKYFQLFRTKILPLVHTQKNVDQLFTIKTEEEQVRFFHSTWNNWRWRLLFNLFFSKFVMGRFGRDPAFLKEVKIPVSTFILNQSKDHLSSIASQNNYFLQFIMKGSFETELPYYARESNFEIIKSRIDRLTTYHGLAEDAFNKFSDFDKFNLSNIFEYMNPEVFQAVSQNLVENSNKGARFAYWNLMVDRQMSRVIQELNKDQKSSEKLTKKDNGFFYSSVNIDVKQ